MQVFFSPTQRSMRLVLVLVSMLAQAMVSVAVLMLLAVYLLRLLQ
jgi:hypothetical protein